MSTRVFIAGSMNIKHLDSKVKTRIDNILEQDFEVIVGDADGADRSVQAYLFNHGTTKATSSVAGHARGITWATGPFSASRQAIQKDRVRSLPPKTFAWPR